MQWFIFFLVIQGIHGLGTWKLYTIAGRQAWEAFIPVYNAVILMKIISLLISLSRVDFPAPDKPIIATNSPS